MPYIGRKGALAISSGKFYLLLFLIDYLTKSLRMIGLTGVFLFASTTARSSNALLGWNCGYTFSSNVGVKNLKIFFYISGLISDLIVFLFSTDHVRSSLRPFS